jgi:hypothetical protein
MASGDPEANAACEGAELSRSEATQHRSASACLVTRVLPPLSDSDLCVGHVSLFVQQAIRACGVGAQPAHTATFPASNARVNTTDGICLNRTSTCPRMR